MRRRDFVSMGDRQKAFESIEAGRQLMPGAPVLVRLDGKSFHTFTRGLAKPYDVRLSSAMTETAKYLVDKTCASIGYTQSDEISLVYPNAGANPAGLFEGRIQKLCSILAAMATAKFNQQIMEKIPEKADLLPVFDSRVWAVSSLDIAAEHFIWREADATRNSVNMAASSLYSAKELKGVSQAQAHELLYAKGINWNDYPSFFKRGTYVRRETDRSAVVELEMPPITKVLNINGVLFFGEDPV